MKPRVGLVTTMSPDATWPDQVMKQVEEGWPMKGKKYKGEIHAFWTQRESLNIAKGLLLRGETQGNDFGTRVDISNRKTGC